MSMKDWRSLGNDSRDDLMRSIHLSASAGSGKTRALVERYMDLITKAGIELDQAVAITFTDKAAAEMKQRVMQTITDAARAGKDIEALFKRIIRGRQDLRISTIHSFCMNILKRYPLEAGVPPDFGIMDIRDRRSRIERAVESALDKKGRDAAIMSVFTGYTPDIIESKIKSLLSIRSRLKRIEIDAGGESGFIAWLESSMQIEKAEEELNRMLSEQAWRQEFFRMEAMLKTQGEYYEKCRGREHALLAQAQRPDDIFMLFDKIFYVYFTNESKPRKKHLIPKKDYIGDRKEFEDIYTLIQGHLEELRLVRDRIRSGRQVVNLLRLYFEAERQYSLMKLREGLLDFDDLEIYAYSLLKQPEALDILYRLDRRILHFLIDEFQDTSDIQWAILEKLTEEIFAGKGSDKPMRPTLFIVGDEKQSIYRFREANYRLLETVRNKMEHWLPDEARRIRTLTTNYRSVPQIIETVNQVFEKLWKEGYLPSDTERRSHMGSVRLIEIEAGYNIPTASGLLPEAAVLASEIRSIVESGTIVYDRQNDGWKQRRAEYGDCAVLIQSRTRLKDYEAGLQHFGIPYRVIGGIGFYDEEEIQAIMSILFFIWNRHDYLSLALALKSPLFGLSDGDLFRLQQEGRDLFEGLMKERNDLARMFEGWIKDSGLMPVSILIRRIISDTAAYVHFGRLFGAQAIFNIDKLLDTAREFDSRGYTTIHDFAKWVKDIRRTEEQEATADVTLPEYKGSVVITTVHKSKGLEFPVVFLPGMNQTTRALTQGPEAIIETTDHNVSIALRNNDSLLYNSMWEREKQELLRENQRLLYVAMTRARDHLIMIGALGDNHNVAIKKNSWLYFMHEASPMPLFEKKTAPAPKITLYSWPEELPKAGQAPTSAKPIRDIDPIEIVANLSPVAPGRSLEWLRAVDLIKEPAEDELAFITQTEAVFSTIRGSLMHRCLEELTRRGSYDIRSIAHEFPQLLSFDKKTRDNLINNAEAVLISVIGNPVFSWIFDKARQGYFELPFVHKKGDTIISGVIDRLIIEENRGFVIDYKAIAPATDEEVLFWKRHYLPQIRIYCEAVKEIFRLDRVEGFLLFLDSSRLESLVAI